MRTGWLWPAVAAWLVLAAVAAYQAPVLLVPLGFFAIIAVRAALSRRRLRRTVERTEALFARVFPELQPWYHPKRVYDFAAARLAEKAIRSGSGGLWNDPPGFPGLAADIRPDGAREVVRILDPSGAPLTQFTFERHAEGAAIRVGGGKLTVATRDKDLPRVRYWHPEREFKWTPSSWKMKTSTFEHSFAWRITGNVWSDFTRSSTRGVPE